MSTSSLEFTRHLETPLLTIETVGCHGVHTHTEEWAHQSELVFIRRGAFSRYDHHGDVLADSNHILFFDRDRPYQVAHPIEGGDACTIFHLRADVLGDLMHRFDPSHADRPDMTHPLGMLPVSPDQQLTHHHLLHAARRDHDPLAIEEAALTLYESILAAAFDASPVDHASPDHADLVDAVRIHLARTFRDRSTLDDIAAAVHTSPYHLARLFKAHTGRGIHQYRVDLRLHDALERLADPRQPITDLALDLGFHSHSHFTTAFRQTFDQTPSAFRRSASMRTLAQSRNILQA